jgi:hypothetical protein
VRSRSRESTLFGLDQAVRMLGLTTLEGMHSPVTIAALASLEVCG